MNLTTTLGRLRLISICEGWSFLILVLIAMPLKYLAGQPEAVRIVGMAHGILFLAMIAMAVHGHFYFKWSFKRTGLIILGALIPLGPFVVDAKILKPIQNQ